MADVSCVASFEKLFVAMEEQEVLRALSDKTCWSWNTWWRPAPLLLKAELVSSRSHSDFKEGRSVFLYVVSALWMQKGSWLRQLWVTLWRMTDLYLDDRLGFSRYGTSQKVWLILRTFWRKLLAHVLCTDELELSMAAFRVLFTCSTRERDTELQDCFVTRYIVWTLGLWFKALLGDCTTLWMHNCFE